MFLSTTNSKTAVALERIPLNADNAICYPNGKYRFSVGQIVAFLDEGDFFLLGSILEFTRDCNEAKVLIFETGSERIFPIRFLAGVRRGYIEGSFPCLHDYSSSLALVPTPTITWPSQDGPWIPNDTESKRLVDSFGTDHPFQIIPWRFPEIAVVMLACLSSREKISCYRVCTSWKNAMMKVWPNDDRYLAGLQVEEAECSKLILDLILEQETITIEKNNETILAIKAKQGFLRSKIEAHPLKVWFKQQPKILQDPNHVIPAYPFNDTVSKYFVTESTSIPLEFSGCFITPSIDLAIQNCTQNGIIYLDSGKHEMHTFPSRQAEFFFEKNLQIIGKGEKESHFVMTSDWNSVFFTNCSIRFQNVRLDLQNYLFVKRSNLWFDNCRLELFQLNLSHRSSLFLSNSRIICARSPGFHIVEDSNALISHDCTISGFQALGFKLFPSSFKCKSDATTLKMSFRKTKFIDFNHALFTNSQSIADYLRSFDGINFDDEENRLPRCLSLSEGCKVFKSLCVWPNSTGQ